MELLGRSFIGFARGDANGSSVHSINPAGGQKIPPVYHGATAEEVEAAAALAATAFIKYGRASGRTKASLLKTIAANLEASDEAIVDRAHHETALPQPRLRAELGRTCNQLRMFADLVDEGSWVDARIDLPQPNRQPLSKPDVRSMLQPLGPVVVFCASNFPLAFSVAGGDTASALAAGNPVIVKAHHAHPGTAEIVASAIVEAIRECGLPEGVFSLIYGSGKQVGTQLVRHPLVKAGGFTGSRAGGQELMRLASARPEPIPFYAEMSSVNPIFVFPAALDAKMESFASGLHASVTLGAGQFCTNPGLVFVPQNESEALIQRLEGLFGATSPFIMLTSEIAAAYKNGVETLSQKTRVELVVNETGVNGSSCAAVFVTDIETFAADPDLSAEVFGPATLLIKYSNYEQLLGVARTLEGQLTATIHADDVELKGAGDLIEILEKRAGRLIFNRFPTGVEVGPAMVHGGPYPATSDGRSSSVGTRAILRFVRPVCYQDWPDYALPAELQNANPLKLWRLVDGQMKKESLTK